MKRQYFPALDGMRGVAALAVLGFHLSLLASPRLGLFPRGHLAVDFFFLLSGFVIENAYGWRTLNLSTFVTHRVVRLYPMIVLGAVIGAIFDPGASTGLFLLELTSLPDLNAKWIYPLNTPMWSMLFELTINLAFFIVFRHARSRTLWAVVGASAACLILVSIKGHTINVGPEPGYPPLAAGLPRVTFSFVLGMLLQREKSRLDPLPPVHWLVLAAVLLVLLSLPDLARANLLVDLLLAFVALPVLLAMSVRATVPDRQVPACAALGLLSYPLYLVHMPLITFAGAHGWLSTSAGQLATVLLVILVGGCATWLYDIPVRGWLNRAPLHRAVSGMR